MVGNKDDAQGAQRHVTDRLADSTYARLGKVANCKVNTLGFVKMSVKDGEGMEEPFHILAKHLLESGVMGVVAVRET